MTRIKGILLVCSVLLAAGCLSGPFAPPDKDRAAKTFTPSDQQANVYVARDAAWPGYQCRVSIDGSFAGLIGSRSFVLASVTPGTHVARCEIFDHTAEVRFQADAGKNYFFEVVASPAWNVPTVELRESGEDPGRALVTQGRLAAGAIP
jgi:hypothetical protein